MEDESKGFKIRIYVSLLLVEPERWETWVQTTLLPCSYSFHLKWIIFKLSKMVKKRYSDKMGDRAFVTLPVKLFSRKKWKSGIGSNILITQSQLSNICICWEVCTAHCGSLL